MAYIQGDADISVWIGTKADAFTSPQTLSDVYLAGLGFTEVNDTGTSSGTRTADINGGTLSGNILIVAAQTGSETNDGFKISKLVLGCPGPSISLIKKTNGTDGNTRLFNNSTIRASAWARSRTSGAWSTAWLGLYSSSGLGVTDNSEGSGSNNRHIVDNNGNMENYVLLEFKTPVTIDKVGLSYIQGDGDISVWIGTKADAFTGAQTLTDAYLTSLGFTEVNDTSVSSGTRSADINGGNVSGNIVIIAAQTGSETNDGFKVSSVTLICPAPSAPAPEPAPASAPASAPAPALVPKSLWLPAPAPVARPM